MPLKNFLCLFALASIVGCVQPGGLPLPENYHADLEEWKSNRDARLRASNGWVNLAGLYWLEPGENSFGSGEQNNVRFPAAAPEVLGTIRVTDSAISLIVETGQDILVDSTIQTNAVVYDENAGIRSVMESGRYRWFIIERSGKYGIRLRDLESPRMKEPLNIPYYDWSNDWRVKAVFRPFPSPEILTIQNVVGLSYEDEFSGELIFEVDGKSYSLWPTMDDESSWIMFGDATSGDGSYGSGRYLVAGLPDENNEVTLDFNKAYNPPCAFTDFATCPLPPQQNMLDLAVKAGEMEFHFPDKPIVSPEQ